MKNNGHIKANSIFVRLIITFICILVPLYTLCIQIFSWGIKTLEDEITTAANRKVSFYIDDFEMEIQRMKFLQYDCMEDENLSSLAVRYQIMDDYERYRTILALIQRLNTIKNSSRYIEDVRIHIPSIKKTLSAEDGVSNLMDYEVTTIMRSNPQGKAQIVYDNNRLLIPAAYPTPIYTQKSNPMFIIVIELLETNFLSTIKQLVSYNEGGSILIFQPDNYILNSDVNNSEIENILYDISNSTDIIFSQKISNREFSVICATSEYLGWTLVEYIPENIVYEPIARYHFLLNILIFSSVLIIFIYSIMTYKFVHQPLQKLVGAFKKVKKGELDIRLMHHYNNEFGYIYVSFNSMVENLHSLIEQIYKQEILKQRAELKHLQSQINPHFLYNSFFILRSVIHNQEYDKAEDLIQKIGDYFQFITRSGKDFIPLLEEVRHAKIYTEIQMTRFSNRVHIMFENLPEKYADIYVPRLILQPIIENAFEHGLKNKIKDGILQVRFTDQDNTLFIIIEENGDELEDENLEKMKNSILGNNDMEITGMVNIHRRLQMKLGGNSGLNVSRSELGGLKIVINVPLEYTSNTSS